MRKVSHVTLILVACAFLLSLAAVTFNEEANAIPPFARKYKISCSTCHIAVPKLKAYGEDFAGNGFVLPDGEEPKRATIDTGDDKLLLQRDFPLGVRIDAYLRALDTETADADLQVPYGLKFLSGGRITKNVSYYFYFYAYERGEVAGLEDAYIHFNNIGGSEFDIMAGQFQVSDPLFKRELRLTFEDYQMYRIRVGDTRANLTYDRGIMLTYGFDFGLDLVGQIVNGNGIPEAENRIFDIDTEKAYALRASQSVGPVRIGAFGYYNKEKGRFLADEESPIAANELWYAGVDGTVGGARWELNAQYLRREDDNPFFLTGDTTVATSTLDGGLAELTILPNGDDSRWIVVALYNRVEGDSERYDVETATLSLNHMAARNLRFVFEGTYNLVAEEPAFTIGAMGGF